MKMRWLFCDDSDERLNMSVYDELAGHSAAVLGEIDSGAELIVTDMSVYDELAGHSAAVLGELDSEAELIVTGLYKPLL